MTPKSVKAVAKKKAAPKKAKTASKKSSTKAAPDAKKKAKKKPPKITILPKYCKGCGICIALCPTQVLGFDEGKATVVDLDACIKCMFCELRCPDFAISVEEQS